MTQTEFRLSKPKVMARLPWSAKNRQRLEGIFAPADIVFVDRQDTVAIAQALQTCEMALIDGVMDDRYRHAPRLKWVHCDQSGLDGYAPQWLADSDLVVTSSKGRSGPVLAEHAVFFMLSLAYHAPALARAQRHRVWGIRDQELLRGLHGRKVCIVGYGATGSSLAHQCAAFGMEITAFRRKDIAADVPSVKMFSAARGARLIDAIGGADFVVLCASLNDDSYRMLGADELAALAPGAQLVNVARAQLVDEDAMVAALKSGHLAGAGLDVADPNEPLPPWHRLWSVPNVILTPHFTPQMPDRTARTLDILEENYARFLRGEPLLHRFMPEDVFSCAPPPKAFRGRHRLMSAWQRVGRWLR
jgi:phosphoglycerate dehydrogenase-like enzyme